LTSRVPLNAQVPYSLAHSVHPELPASDEPVEVEAAEDVEVPLINVLAGTPMERVRLRSIETS